MKIHEVTRKQQVNEIVGLAANLLGGIAKQAGKQFTQKFNPIGYDAAQQAGGGTDRTGGMAVTKPVVDALTKQMQTAWAQTVQTYLTSSKDAAGNPATSIADLTATSKEGLKAELFNMVNKMIRPQGSFNYQTLSRYVGTDPVAKAAALEMINAINNNGDKIFNATVAGGGAKAVADAFEALVRDGIAPAQNAMSYDQGTAGNKVRVYVDPSGKWIIDLGHGPEWLDKNKPEHKEALEKMNMGGL
jgi:hypothetical protein